MNKKKKIVVIGVGPKCLNIMAKTKALEKFGWETPEVIGIEKTEVGAYWSGSSGYTDGTGILGISIHKIFAYPEESMYGKDVMEYMNKYSYVNYLRENKKLTKWVDGGSKPINHAEFTSYLKWIAEDFRDQIITGEVVKILPEKEQWIIQYKTKKGLEQVVADGVVVTGPGENRDTLEYPKNENSFDGKNFWLNIDKFKDSNEKIALVGGGISAGSIFDKLMPVLNKKARITWFTNRGVFSRSENYFNNQRFSLPNLWPLIPEKLREGFVKQTDRGTIDPDTHNTMAHYSSQIKERIGKINSISTKGNGFELSFEDGVSAKKIYFDKIIMATGFSNTPFLNWINKDFFQKYYPQLPDDTMSIETIFATDINSDMSLGKIPLKMHLPMLSVYKLGIGCATLGSPSVMSDRVVLSYVKNENPEPELEHVKVLKDEQKGESLFANKNLSKGTTIVEGFPKFFTTSRTKTSVQISNDLHFEPSYWFLKANHSCEPNCGIKKNKYGGYSIVAMKDIEADEEITWDYSMTEYESISLEENPCKCESENCRIKIGGYKNLSEKLKQKYDGFIAPYLIELYE